MATTAEKSRIDALNRLRSTEPPVWLAPNAQLSETARTASKHLFSFLKPFAPKSPFDHLLVDGFDCEQIWQQIDIQSQPVLSSLRREVKRFEKNPEEVSRFEKVLEGEEKVVEERSEGLEEGSYGFDEELDDFDDEEEEEDEDGEDGEGRGKGKESEEEGESEDERDEDELSDAAEIEDEFLKINELEDYLKKDEAREYGFEDENKKKRKKGKEKGYIEEDEEEDEDEGEEDEEDDDDDDDDELGMFGDEDDANESARYEDFYGSKKKKVPKRKPKLDDESEEDLGIDDEQDHDDGSIGDEQDDDAVQNQKNDNLSSHEKQLKKLKTKIEQMEKANLEPKTWTMQGEVTAARRPKNSALEVDLDFEHNVRPAPVITEEVTQSLEDLIQKRILEGRFDDVQRASKLTTKAPRELKELDENKSKKGLAEVYEDEYVRKTDPGSLPLSSSDEQKKEASLLFKKLCVKLDALSHFHFTPKPIIDDMSIQMNVPALAMEEIAPLAVSDAAMLAPEEVFGGRGDIKEESELTQAERKRRRANKKRKHKADKVKKMAKKARGSTLTNNNEVKEE